MEFAMTLIRHPLAPEPALTPAQRPLARAMTEAALQQAVIECAKTLGWVVRHIRDSRRQNAEGLPDLLLLHPRQRRVLWAELKREKGTMSLEQDLVIDALLECGQMVYLWRPSDWLSGGIERVLRSGTAVRIEEVLAFHKAGGKGRP